MFGEREIDGEKQRQFYAEVPPQVERWMKFPVAKAIKLSIALPFIGGLYIALTEPSHSALTSAFGYMIIMILLAPVSYVIFYILFTIMREVVLSFYGGLHHKDYKKYL